MKTAVYLPDTLFDRADKLAKNLKVSRSQLFQDALEQYLINFEAKKITKKLDQIYGEVKRDDLQFIKRSAQNSITTTEW